MSGHCSKAYLRIQRLIGQDNVMVMYLLEIDSMYAGNARWTIGS